MWTINAAWNLFFGWFSIAGMVGVGAVLVAVFTPPFIAAIIPNLRTVAILVAAGAFSFSTVAGKFYHDGLSVKQAEWDAAEKRGKTLGSTAADRATRDVDGGVPDDFDRDDH